MANAHFSDAGVDAALSGITGTAVSLHTADPGTTGASEVTGGSYARVATTWAVASGSARQGSQVTLNVPAGTTITHFGIWSGSTFLCGGPLSAPETFAAAGTYLLTPSLAGQG